MADPGSSDVEYTDITCTVCGRHNRDVHMVGAGDGLVLCSVCVARCAEVLDAETGVAGPAEGWVGRWPGK